MKPEPTTFASYGQPEQSPRQWPAALLGTVLVYLLATMALVWLGTATRRVLVETRADLTFVEPVAKPEPPPPAPVVEAPVAVAAPAAAPVVRPDQKVRKLEKPPLVKNLVAPKQMPKDLPKEVDPNQDKGVAVYGEPGAGDPAGLEGGMQTGVVGGKVGVIDLPADATAPRPLASNLPPRYPESARRRGKTGRVVLKIAIYADGAVGEISIVDGEEPFITAAKNAVSRWRFEPARSHGQAISVYRLLPIAFNLED